jgi:two-component system phosphate regulon response regulator PhoB
MPILPADSDHDRRSVILVEDAPTLGALLADALRDEGYDVLTATDGAEAIRLLEDRAVDESVCLVVLDMFLPQVDGAGVLRHIAKQGRPIPVIAMSGDVLQLGRALRTGAREALAKPFELESFLHTVTRVCGATDRE